jgi:hypothetical protein
MAVRVLANVVQGTGLVMAPYRTHPSLMGMLLALLLDSHEDQCAVDRLPVAAFRN